VCVRVFVCRSNVILPRLPQERSVGTKLSAFLVARCFQREGEGEGRGGREGERERGREGERERGREGLCLKTQPSSPPQNVCKYVHMCTYIYM